MKKVIPYIIMLLPPLFWAGNFIVGKAVSEQHIPIGLSFWRWFFATLIFLPFVYKSIYQNFDIIKKNIVAIALLSVLSIAGFNTLAYISLLYTSATNATLLNSLIPIFIIFLSMLFIKEDVSKKQILGIIVSLVGVIIILSKMNMEIILNINFNKGDLWMLLAALDWALYSMLLRKFRPKELDPLTFLGTMMVIGTFFILILFLINPFDEPFIKLNKSVVYTLAYIAIFPSIVSYLAWNYGMQKLGATAGGQYIHLMPLFGAIMAVIFLKESIKDYHIIGGLFIGAGIYFSIKSNRPLPKK